RPRHWKAARTPLRTRRPAAGHATGKQAWAAILRGPAPVLTIFAGTGFPPSNAGGGNGGLRLRPARRVARMEICDAARGRRHPLRRSRADAEVVRPTR